MKSLFNGLIIINTKKLKQIIAASIYMTVYIIHKLLTPAAVLMLLGTIGAGGDGKYYDGNIKIAVTCMILFFICCALTRITGIFLEHMPKSYKAHVVKHAEVK